MYVFAAVTFVHPQHITTISYCMCCGALRVMCLGVNLIIFTSRVAQILVQITKCLGWVLTQMLRYP